jgi:transcription antitermination protein NusB
MTASRPPESATRSPAMASARSRSRLAAVQALYQMALTSASAEAVVREFVHHRLGPQNEPEHGAADATLFAELVQGVEAAGGELDDMIAAVLADNHDVERLETVLKVVLRAGAFELSHRLDVPAPVTIKEYVDVAEAFYDKRETKFVNAVLDRLARALRPEELEDRPGGPTPLAG